MVGDAWPISAALQRHLIDQRQPGHAPALLHSGAADCYNKEHSSSCIPRFSCFPFPFPVTRCDNFNTHQ